MVAIPFDNGSRLVHPPNVMNADVDLKFPIRAEEHRPTLAGGQGGKPAVIDLAHVQPTRCHPHERLTSRSVLKSTTKRARDP